MEQMIRENVVSVKVLGCVERWFGVTYAEDKQKVKASIAGLKADGTYPEQLSK